MLKKALGKIWKGVSWPITMSAAVVITIGAICLLHLVDKDIKASKQLRK